MLLKFSFFRARFFTKKRQKTLCVTVRNFAQFYFVYLYAKIDRFLINERRTYPYIYKSSALRASDGVRSAHPTSLFYTPIFGYFAHPQLHRNRPQIALFAAKPLGETTRYFLRACVFRLWFSHIIRAALRFLVFPPTLPADFFRLPSQ